MRLGDVATGRDVVEPSGGEVMTAAAGIVRVWGVLVTGGAVAAGALAVMAVRASGVPSTAVLPVMVLPLLVVVAAVGLCGIARPVWGSRCAVGVAVLALQVAGIAVVARRDWFNFAGAGGMAYQHAAVAARVTTVLAVVAAGTAVLGLLLGGRDLQWFRTLSGRRSMLAGAAVVIGVPVLACAVLGYRSMSAFGQFVLWWSLPWGVGVAAAGLVATRSGRMVAWSSVAFSMLVTLAAVAAPLVHGPMLRLPD